MTVQYINVNGKDFRSTITTKNRVELRFNDGVHKVEYKRLFNYGGLTFVLHRPYKTDFDRVQQQKSGWNVSELTTGLLVQDGKTMKEAIQNTKDIMQPDYNQNGQTVKDAVKYWVEHYGKALNC